jgi:hypothetical protein
VKPEEESVEFGDYCPSEVPQAFPVMIWANWDSCGEFMTSTQDPTEGKALVELAARGCGYTVVYTGVLIEETKKGKL